MYGPPPAALAIRICSLVSLKSLPAMAVELPGAAGDVGEAEAGPAAGTSNSDLPSRKAFSRAAFSARARLSASIWARMAAFAFASSILSIHQCNGRRCQRTCETEAMKGKMRRYEVSRLDLDVVGGEMTNLAAFDQLP
jgi:hypothetical protein